ncbi:hypothetical protein [Microbacterium sp. H1-D42]|uniref:hypothetical protein n=1 Tax=Microbacterium sp. H1-D42 TaxID=2925844 RepID=UPI001F532FD0|nr:hypothetical protein [Microbacterium sp. H1-D42]UNK71735.1 hypothetical protein MNR00_04555 [Microbacterium sp. H1-D42]
MSKNTETPVRTTKIHTLDDLHESDFQELLQCASGNPAATPAWFVEGGFFSEEMLEDRRRAVRHFDCVTAPDVKHAIRRIRESRSWKLFRRVDDIDMVLTFAFAVLEKIGAEDEFAGLEQFGPIKRSVNRALRDWQ